MNQRVEQIQETAVLLCNAIAASDWERAETESRSLQMRAAALARDVREWRGRDRQMRLADWPCVATVRASSPAVSAGAGN